MKGILLGGWKSFRRFFVKINALIKIISKKHATESIVQLIFPIFLAPFEFYIG